MSTNDLELIKAKIQKLLALSKHNPDVNEAAAALAKANELMLRYRIDRVGVESAQVSSDIVEMIIYGEARARGERSKIPTWKLHIARAIAEVNGCTTFYTMGQTIHGIGREADLQIVKYLFEYVENQIEVLCKAASKLRRDTIPGWDKSQGRIYANNFKLGAANTIKLRLQESIEKLKKQEYELATSKNDATALIRLDAAFASIETHRQEAEDFMSREHPGLRTLKKRYVPNADGWRDGRRAGHHVDLDKTKRNKLPG